MNKAQIQDAINRLSATHETLAAGSDTLLWCKQHALYDVLEDLRELSRADSDVRLVAVRLELIFRYRGCRVFVQQLGSVINELKGIIA